MNEMRIMNQFLRVVALGVAALTPFIVALSISGLVIYDNITQS